MGSKVDVEDSTTAILRKRWDKAVQKELDTPDTYRKVAVLIIRWKDLPESDFSTKNEAEELESIFREGFNFHTETVILTNSRRPQVLLDRAIANFVAEHDGPHRSHLLLVYYTGHGSIKVGDKDLFILGEGSPDPGCEDQYPLEARWSQAEVTLNDAEADVLTILDCCFAASVMKYPTGHALMSHELLAACGSHEKCQNPGPRSYTRALIDSLEEVLRREDKRISTFDLNQMILSRRIWNTKYTARLSNRSQTCARHICLAPLPQNSDPKTDEPEGKVGHLDLRLTFQQRICPPGEEMEHIATDLSRAAKSSKMDVSAIELVGFKPAESEAPDDVSSQASHQRD